MKKATPVQMRKAIEMVEILKKAGIRFVPVPVSADVDYKILMSELSQDIKKIESYFGDSAD